MPVRTLAIAVALVAAGAGVVAASVPAPPASEREAAENHRTPHDPPVPPAISVRRPIEGSLPFETIRWRRSRVIGLPWDGRLVGGVRLPAGGAHFFTWDPVLRRSPNRPWRRFGSDRLVRTLMRIVAEFAAAHPQAPRIAIGDLSRTAGGDFGVRYGRPGHASHQNGLDADIYYPRSDRRERPPRTVAQIERPLAQELVDRFVRAGARHVFVGPSTGLRGPPAIVQPLAHHDYHLHVRFG